MEKQATDWSEGDLTAYMMSYKQSDSLIFLGRKGIRYGWQESLSSYQKSYPTKEKMGKLKFEYDYFKPLGKEHMLVAGKWNLYRSADTLSGYFSLLWEKQQGQWKIIFDHTP